VSAPRKPEPLTLEEERALFNNRGFLSPYKVQSLSVGDIERIFATLDAARERIAAVERERDEARANAASFCGENEALLKQCKRLYKKYEGDPMGHPKAQNEGGQRG
jgi:hypothetical protein